MVQLNLIWYERLRYSHIISQPHFISVSSFNQLSLRHARILAHRSNFKILFGLQFCYNCVGDAKKMTSFRFQKWFPYTIARTTIRLHWNNFISSEFPLGIMLYLHPKLNFDAKLKIWWIIWKQEGIVIVRNTIRYIHVYF